MLRFYYAPFTMLRLLCSAYQDFLIVAGVVAMPRDELLLRMEHGDMQTVTGGAVLYPQVCLCPLLLEVVLALRPYLLGLHPEFLYLTYVRAYPTISCGRSPTPPTAHELRSRSRSN